jgi:hypothetical protein
MARWNAILVLVALVGLLSQESARADESPTAELAKRSREVRKKLAAPIDFLGIDDPDTKLSEALDLLNKITGLTFEINEQAFRDEMIDDVTVKPLGREIRKATGVSAGTVLRRILARIPTSTGTTFVVRGGAVEVTTRRYASPSQWRRVEEDSAQDDGLASKVIVPQTSIDFDKRPLRDALQEIADATGVNIVVDPRTQERGKATVTATLQNADVDTVLKLLADTADLQVVLVNDVFYVTTKENVKVLREDKGRMKPADVAPHEAE